MRGPEDSINKATNPKCPACKAKRQHTVREWKQHHPLAGSGDNRDYSIKKK